MVATDENSQEQKPKISRLSIWAVMATVIICVIISICVSLEKLFIFGTIFFLLFSLGGSLIRVILHFMKKEKGRWCYENRVPLL
jgi:uncharacterized membrane protein